MSNMEINATAIKLEKGEIIVNVPGKIEINDEYCSKFSDTFFTVKVETDMLFKKGQVRTYPNETLIVSAKKFYSIDPNFPQQLENIENEIIFLDKVCTYSFEDFFGFSNRDPYLVFLQKTEIWIDLKSNPEYISFTPFSPSFNKNDFSHIVFFLE